MNRRSTFVPIFVAILCGWIATTVAQVQRMLGTIVDWTTQLWSQIPTFVGS